jgi:hypothetical protein
LSSTNRSTAREEHIADYYVTPINSIVDFIDEFVITEDGNFDGKILDPCAGGDIKHHMSYPEAFKKREYIHIDTIDIRKDSLAGIKDDYLKTDCKNKYNVIITNPPFNISLNIINKALDDVKEGGWVIMLLRLNYFGSDKRKPLFEAHMPKYCFVHSKRMSFSDNGGTDSIEYAHFCWHKGENPEFTMLKVI